jgi:hypothetical protein
VGVTLTTLLAQLFGIDSILSEPELADGLQQERRISTTGADKEIDIRGVPGIPVPGNRQRSDDQVLNFVRVQALDKLAQILA